MEKLNTTNCLPKVVNDSINWRLETLPLLEGYQLSICMPEEINEQMNIVDVTESFGRTKFI